MGRPPPTDEIRGAAGTEGAPPRPRRGLIASVVKALRPHQWSKNLLLFLSPVLAHVDRPEGYTPAVLAFVTFSLLASAVYVINDVVDREADREHPTKRHRPFASGDLGVSAAYVLVPILVGVSLGVAWWRLPTAFLLVLLGYLTLTSLYSFLLKRLLIVDVLTLALLFTYRVLAGGIAIDVPTSFWVLAFSVFFFTGLALAKRYSELADAQDKGKATVSGRGYRVEDLPLIRSLGSTTGTVAVLVFCLYLDSPKVKTLYAFPQALWLIVPLLLYWVMRVWFLANRRELHDDPVVFALKDTRSWLTLALVCVFLLVAKFG